jgi:hypothetical protein
MVFQPIRCTAPCVAIGTGELLPHLFTLATSFAFAQEGRTFSVTLLYPRGYLPVRKYGALCCPDFPTPLTKANVVDGSACCDAKVGKCGQIFIQTL